jgi:SAM-dependent methyltransferase
MRYFWPMSDVLGSAIMDFWQTGKNKNILVEINGKRDRLMPSSLFFREYKNMIGYERLALKYARGRILDVGAAAGCHSLVLQKRGLEVTAIEKSSLSAEVMRNRGVKNVLEKDLFKLKNTEFDTILLLMNGLGVCGSKVGLKKMLAHLKTILSADGQILGDSTDVRYAARKLNSAGRDISKYYGDVEFSVTYGTMKESFPWVFIDPDTLQTTAELCGLDCQILYSDDGAHYLVRMSHMA